MAQRELLENALNKARRILAELEIQAAGYTSLNLPAHHKIEIEDKQLEIASLEERLSKLDQAETPLVPSSQKYHELAGHYSAILDTLLDGQLVFYMGRAVNRIEEIDEGISGDQRVAARLIKTFLPANGSNQELTRVAQQIAVLKSLGELYDVVKQEVATEDTPNHLHHFLAALPAILKAKGCLQPYQLIVTSNYDDLLEQAFEQAKEPFDLVAYIAEGKDFGKFRHWAPGDNRGRLIDIGNEYNALSLRQRSIIFKVVGAVKRADPLSNRYMITEDHFIRFLNGNGIENAVPATILDKLRNSRLLFLGQGTQDWNQRLVLLRLLEDEEFSYPAWAIQTEMTQEDLRYWRKLEAEPICYPLKQYIQGLWQQLEEFAPPGGDK